MDWFKCIDKTGTKRIINTDAILSVTYLTSTNLTEITFIRSAFPPLFIKGDVLKDIERLLSAHDHYVSKIGE